jgi:competence protein ComEC
MAPQLSSFPPYSDHLFALLVAVAFALFVVLPHLQRRDIVLFVGAAGLFWATANAVIDDRLAGIYEGDSILTKLRVTDFPRVSDTSTSFIAAPLDDARVPGRVRLNWQEPPVPLRIGDVWQLEIRLRRPRGNSNPGSMDYEAWLFRERIGAAGYVVEGNRNVLLDSFTSRGIEQVRIDFLDETQRTLGDDAAVPVIIAVAIGSRHLLTAEAWDRYARTGTSHLMAISGLHVGLAAVAAYVLAAGLLGLSGRGNHHLLAVLVALAVACAYAAVSGFAVPARRATLMLFVATAILVARREVSSARVLSAAVIVIILSDPIATAEPGFKLSFAAVAILLWYAKQRQAGQTNPWRRGYFAARSLVFVQLLLFIGLMPLTVSIFGRVSIAAPLINLLAIPLFSFITVPSVLLSLALPDSLQAIAAMSLQIAAMSIGWLEYVILAAANRPQASIPIAGLRSAAFLLLLLPLVWLALPPGWPARHIAWLGAIALLLWRPQSPSRGCVDIRALDVGQGMSFVLQTHDRTLVYDTGPSWQGGNSAAERVLVPYLHYSGIARVDRLIVSHADLDHAGGVRALLANFEVSHVSAGEDLPWIERNISPCRAGESWIWNGVRFSILYPDTALMLEGNAASCVLLVEAGEYKALLSGDIESESEAQLVRQRILPTVDVATVPHHGSRTSSIGPFVLALAPSYAIVSAGHGNRWGFPKPDVVARWRSAGAKVLNTAESGSISVQLCAENGISKPLEWRNQRRRIWQEDDS